MVTVIHEEREVEIAAARVDGDALWLSSSDAHRATGWTLTSEGLCAQDACVPLPPGREAWVLGTGARDRARVLQSLQAPDFTLPDLDDRMHALSEHRGRKVLLATWASW
jgi:hypothetical protein